jgi:hypothetical protein
MQDYSDTELKEIGEYILVETPLARADVCILFGCTYYGKEHSDHLAEGAADLYFQGYFDLIIPTGGVYTDDGRTEAERMRDILLARGIPKKKIILENKAQSIIENIIYSMAILDDMFGIEKIKSMMAIGHIHASRRFLMTLERQWPEVIKMFKTSNCFDVPVSQWHTQPDFKKGVIFEWENTPLSLARDYIREIDLEKVKTRIAGLPPPIIPKD